MSQKDVQNSLANLSQKSEEKLLLSKRSIESQSDDQILKDQQSIDKNSLPSSIDLLQAKMNLSQDPPNNLLEDYILAHQRQ